MGRPTLSLLFFVRVSDRAPVFILLSSHAGYIYPDFYRHATMLRIGG